VRLETQVGVQAEAQKARDTFRVVEAEPEANERTEIVGDQPDPPTPERVEQREHVGENLVHGARRPARRSNQRRAGRARPLGSSRPAAG
jgi:hypothetical protein